MGEAVSINRHASGIDQVWRGAFEKRLPDRAGQEGLSFTPQTSRPAGAIGCSAILGGKGAAALDDAVDEVIERVIANGGEVFFYDPGVLDVHQQIAAVLRY